MLERPRLSLPSVTNDQAADVTGDQDGQQRDPDDQQEDYLCKREAHFMFVVTFFVFPFFIQFSVFTVTREEADGGIGDGTAIDDDDIAFERKERRILQR